MVVTPGAGGGSQNPMMGFQNRSPRSRVCPDWLWPPGGWLGSGVAPRSLSLPLVFLCPWWPTSLQAFDLKREGAGLSSAQEGRAGLARLARGLMKRITIPSGGMG